MTNAGPNGTIITNGNDTYGIYANAVAAAAGKNSPGSNATATTTIVNSGTVKTYGSEDAVGIQGNSYASSLLGSATASSTANNSGWVSTQGSWSPGIALNAFALSLNTATASVSVSNSGVVTTSGSNSAGLLLYAGAASAQGALPTATITVNNSGSIITTGYGSAAIDATTLCDPCSITINNSNHGQIVAAGEPYTAIWAATYGNPGPININNNSGGLIQGNVRLYGSTGTFVNAGHWIMQGNSYFGSGTGDSLNNTSTGLITMLDSYPPSGSRSPAIYGSTKGWGDAYIAGAHYSGIGTYYQNGPVLSGGHHLNLFHTVFLNGLDNFTNAGWISLHDGYANQQVVVSGNFIGAGGHLYVDANLGKPGSVADLFTVGGTVSGTTHIVVNDTKESLFGAYNPTGIPVVIVGTGDSPVNAFDLPQGPIVKGLFDYDLYLNQDKNVWVLASTPGKTANELPRIMTAVQEVWHQSAGVWADRTADLRAYLGAPQPACDPRMYTKAPCLAPVASSIGPGVWARAFGDWSHNGGTAESARRMGSRVIPITMTSAITRTSMGCRPASTSRRKGRATKTSSSASWPARSNRRSTSLREPA